MIFPFSFFKSDSKEILQAVRFPDDPNHYLQADITGTWFNDTWSSRTFELYYKNRGISTTQAIFVGSASDTNTTLYISLQLLSSNRIRIAYFRTGPYYYRRDYPIPADGDKHHIILSHKNTGGATRESCYIDGVEVASVSSAYIASTQLVPANQWATIGTRPGITTQPADLDLCYLSIYRNYYVPPGFVTAASYFYDTRDDLNVRRASKPLGDTLPQKPEVFFCANDITDLSSNWTDSNYGTLLNSYGLNNSDIVPW